MKFTFALLLAPWIFLPTTSAWSAPLPPPAAHEVDFAKEIKPLFEAACVKCHAKGKAKGEFSLETREAFLKGGETGAAAEVGKSGESNVVKLVASTDSDEVMPKKGSRWTAEQIGLLRAWIDQGAKWPDGLTFAKPEPQNLKPHAVAAKSLDALVDEYASTRAGALPAVVDDHTFARRVYLDTIGLLPTPDQLDAFIADKATDKRAQLVRALLADNRNYTEHWLTFWNDLLRNDYKGTGFIDGGRRQITGWLYQSLITNKPYDKFVAELIAPRDETSEPFTRGIIWRGVVNASMLQPMQAAQNISQVFMGVNLKCASCHDSFVNDWALADAYGVAAIYSDDPLELIHCDKPTGKTATPRALYPQLGTLDPALAKPARMARFAEVMTGRENGRLSRTIVNRLWAKLLGRGLVEPLDDMDQPAWSPEIIDFLAEDFVAHGYDLKHTIEVILNSHAYQLPSAEGPKDEKEKFVFRGPLTRRLAAEQFADGIASLTGDWARMPASVDIDFTVGRVVGEVKLPKWIWTPEPNEVGEARRLEAAALKAATPAPPAKKDKKPEGNPADLLKHSVVFRKKFTIPGDPFEGFATLLASQGAQVFVNGKAVRAMVGDQSRSNRITLLDLQPALRSGENVITVSVASHTDKGALNDEEKRQFPSSLNHLNTTPGIAFYARIGSCCDPIEIVTDETWHVLRAARPVFDGDESTWPGAVVLPEGVTPVDEGPTLQPIRRKDYANENIALGPRLRAAVATAAFPGKARASLRPADPLAVALDRPNREQVATSRLTAATTLQALELTNGATLDAKLKFASTKLAEQAGKDPRAWLDRTYTWLLSRPPSDTERTTALAFLGDKPTPDRLADLLWSLTMLPEFQLIN